MLLPMNPLVSTSASARWRATSILLRLIILVIAKAMSWNETARKSNVSESVLTFENFFCIFWYSVFMYSQNLCYLITGETQVYASYISGFVQVMENLESHGIGYFNFQAWKVMEFKWRSWKVMEKQYAWQTDVLKIEKITDKSEAGFNFSRNIHKHTFYAL